MKITILQENFIKGLKDVIAFIPSSAQLPLLENVLLETTEKGVALTATDLSLGIKKTARAKVEEKGKTAVNAKNLYSLVGQLPVGKIEVFLEGKQLVLKTENSQANLNTFEHRDFPILKEITNGEKIKREDLSKIAKQIAFAAAGDESRVVLTGVKIEKGEKGERAVATDGFRLSVKNLDSQILGKSEEIIIAARFFSEVEKIIPEKEDVLFEVDKKQKSLIVGWKDTLVNSQLVEGKFPDYEKIIPSSFKTKVLLDREDFERAVKTAAIFARKSANIVRLSVQKGQVEIGANSPQVGKNKNTLTAQVEGEEQKIAFNHRFLLDFLKSVSSNEIIIEISGSLKPGVFKPGKGTSYFHIIMPVRVQDEE